MTTQQNPTGFTRQEVKTLALSSLGGTLEFYDFFIVFFFAKIISEHFFPSGIGEFWAMLNTYGTFAAGYLARPLGGVVMAHFGDKFGRKNMFMLTIALMVIPTFALALIPTFETIGYAAPVILIIVRICQGIAIGGELPGAWVFVHEHAPYGRKNTFVGILTAAAIGGILVGDLVAYGMDLAYTQAEQHAWAWRVPFIIGGIFGMISIYLRRYLDETPVFLKMRSDKMLAKFPLREVLKSDRFGVVVSMFITWVLTGCIVVLILMMPTLAGSYLKLSPFEIIYMQMAGIVLIVLGNIIAAHFADTFNPAHCCKVFAVGFAVLAVVYFKQLYTATPVVSEVVAAYLALCFFAGVMVYCPIFMSDVFPARIRFTGISFAYNIAYAISGAFTPQLTFALHTYGKLHPDTFGSLGLAGYIVLLGLVAIGASMAMHRVYGQYGAKASQMEFRGNV